MRRFTGLWLALVACAAVAFVAPAARAQDKGSGTKFELFKDAKEEYRWRLKAANGQVLATGGQGYKAKADCVHGIEVVQQAGDAKAKTSFEVYQDSSGKEYRWRLKASNGQVMAGSSEGYKSKADCEHAVELVKKSGKAPVEDLTKK